MTPTSYSIAWRPLARDDPRAIVRHIGQDSPANAGRFGAGIRQQVGSLASHPELGRIGRFDGIRELVVHPNYLVFYRIETKDRRIDVLRVRHVAQQTPGL